MNSRVDSILRLVRFVGLIGFLGGLAALASLWAFGPRAADAAQWHLLLSAMRSVFYPCFFAGVLLLVISGTTIWWRRRKTLNQQRWFRVMMVMVMVAVPALHIWARLTMMKLDAAIHDARLIEAAGLWNTLGGAYVIALVVFMAVSVIGMFKPRFGQPSD
jgi:hypothetical protein